MPNLSHLQRFLSQLASAPEGLKRRSMYTRFFFWVTLCLFFAALTILTGLFGSSFLSWSLWLKIPVFALFVLVEPHLEKRLSPIYQRSQRLTALSEKSRDEWTELASTTTDRAKTHAVRTLDRMMASHTSIDTADDGSEWKLVESAQALPGLLLRRDGTFQIGGMNFSQNTAIQGSELSGIHVEKASGMGNPLQVEKDGSSASFRFQNGRWEKHVAPKNQLIPIRTMSEYATYLACFVLCYIALPTLFAMAVVWPHDRTSTVWTELTDVGPDDHKYMVDALEDTWTLDTFFPSEIFAWPFGALPLSPSWAFFISFFSVAIAALLYNHLHFQKLWARLAVSDNARTKPLRTVFTFGRRTLLFNTWPIIVCLMLFAMSDHLLKKNNIGQYNPRTANRTPAKRAEAAPWILRLQIPGAMLGSFAFVAFFSWALAEDPPKKQSKPQPTRAPADLLYAYSVHQEIMQQTSAILQWGGFALPVDRTLSHFAFIGNTRSGKTINQRLLMQSVLPPTILPSDTTFPRGRALVFDRKTEFLPILKGMGLPAETLKVMNPFDERCVPWDIAADTPTIADADNVAEIFVPDSNDEKNGRFFVATSRHVVSSIMQALRYRKGPAWTLRDFVLVCADFSRVEKLLASCPDTEHVIPNYSKTGDTYGNIQATLQTIVKDFRVVAACWHHSKEKPLSMTEWMKSSSILVLGYDATKEATFSVLNRCLIHKISNSILDPSKIANPEKDRTWMFIDEARDLGNLPGLRSLLTAGASRGCSVVLGFQSIKGMQKVFGEEEASEIVGQCDNIALFRMGNDHDTAEWAASLIGKHEKREWTSSQSQSERDWSRGASEQIQERYHVRPERLQEMHATDRAHGLNGYFISKVYGVVDIGGMRISGDTLFSEYLLPEDPTFPAIIPKDPKVQSIVPWTAEELTHFPFGQDDDDPPDWIRKLGRIA